MILALDIGLTTGYAAITNTSHGEFIFDVEVEEHGEMGNTVIEMALPVLLRDHAPREIVIEPPLLIFPGALRDSLQIVVDHVKRLCPRAVEIKPAQWKDSPFGATPLPRGLSAHERDAIRLGLWYRANPDVRLQGQ